MMLREWRRWPRAGGLLEARTFLHALSSNLGYPHYSAAYVQRHIDRPGVDPRELAEFRRTHKLAKIDKRRYALALASTVLFLKMSLWTGTVLNEMDLRDPELNLLEIVRHSEGNSSSGRPQQRLYKFSCLLTNCTGLRLHSVGPTLFQSFGEQLARKLELAAKPEVKFAYELLELPYFSICHPTLSAAHDAIQYIDPELMVLSSLGAGFVLLAGAFLPLINKLRPTSNSMALFLLAPRVSRRLVQERAKTLHNALIISFENYCTSLIESAHTRARLDRRRRAGESRRLGQTGDHPNRPTIATTSVANVQLELVRSRQRRAAALQSRGQFSLNAWADDCVTIMRSRWWLEAGSRQFANMCASLLGALYCAAMAMLPLLVHSLGERRKRLAEIAGQLTALDCAIWAPTAGGARGGQRQQLEMGRLEPNAWWFHLSTLPVLVGLWAISLQVVYICMYYAVNVELACWLNEIKFQLQVAREHCRQMCPPPTLGSAPCCAAEGPPPLFCAESRAQPAFSLAALRARFAPLAGASYMIVQNVRFDNSNSRLQAELALERYVCRTIKTHKLDTEALVEMLQKLFVAFRIFREQVDAYAPTITVMVLFISAYIYSLMAIAIAYIRLVSLSVYLPFAVMLLNWVGANLNFIIPSNFHAKAKELHLLLYSIMAHTSQCGDLRVRHMQSLWLKQIQALDSERGLALRALSVRLTYSRILKLIVATGTVIVFVLGL